jgi:predicted lipid-binding transport protein (Tim44 family)
MGDSLQYIDIVLLAMVAGFVALRLRSVLGRRTGDEEARAEKRRAATASTPAPPAADATVQPRADDFAEAPAPSWTGDIAPDSELGKTLSRIMVADRKFEPSQFVEGARSAYGMIVKAFAEGDRDTLQNLLSPEVYEGFESAILEREKAGQTMETTLIGIEDSRITAASLEKDTAEITIRFETLAASAVRDAEGHVVSGNIADAEKITDLWTFARVLGSNDPNWLLVDTSRED